MPNKNVVVWRPQPGPQTAILQCPVGEVFAGGARGGGKSDVLLGDFAAHAGKYAQHARGILFRRTQPEFEELVKRSTEIYTQLGWEYAKQERRWTAPNGATLILRHLYDQSDAASYQGHQYTFVGIDEVGNYPDPKAIDMMRATLRSAHGVPTFLRMTGNPGGPGHLWLKERYIDPSPPYVPFKYQPQPEEAPGLWIEAVFIPMTLDDNVILMKNDPDYESRLAAVGGPALYRAWRFGDWNAIVGSAFPEWRPSVHVQTREVPHEWRAIGGMDWGYSAPGAFYLAFLGPESEIYVALEYSFNRAKDSEPADTVGEKLGTLLLTYLATGAIPTLPEFIALDSASWSTSDGRGSHHESIAEMIQRGLMMSMKEKVVPVIAAPKGPGSRKAGKQSVHAALKFDVDKEGNVPPWKAPRMTVHPRCQDLIRTLPAIPISPTDPEDVDTDTDDHPYDALRYALASRNPEVYRSAKRATPTDRHPGMKNGKRRKRYEPEVEEASPQRWSRNSPVDGIEQVVANITTGFGL